VEKEGGIMKTLILFLLLVFPLFAEETVETLRPAQVRHLLREARKQYMSEDLQELAEAARIFSAAAEASDPGEVHVDAVRLAEAQAWLKADQHDRALEAFEKIQGFEQAADRARHRLLRGNAQLAMGERALAEENFEAAKDQMNQAIESFVESLMEDPRSADAKRNLEIANRRLQYVIENEPPPPPPEKNPEDQQQEQEKPPEEQEQDGQSQPSQGEGEPDEQKQESEPSEGEEPEEPPSPQPQAREGEGDPSDPQDEPGEPEEPGETEPTEGDLEDLSEEEAQRTLDALLEQERRLREQILQNRRIRTIPVEKDW